MNDDAVLQDIILPTVNETVEKRVNKNEGTISGSIKDSTQSIRLADDASAYRHSNEQRTKRSGEIPAILLIVISALALGIALTITLASLIYHRRRSSNSSQNTDPRSSFYAVDNEPRAWDSLSFSQSITDLSNNKVNVPLASLIYHRRRSSNSSQNTDPRSSFYAVDNEPRAWDSLSFSQSITDLSNNKVNFQSFESLSDDSYINSLDEAINQKASIIHAASKKGRLSSRAQSALTTTTRPSIVLNETNSQHDETSLKQ
uniref:Conserved protein n=1 Tax=Ascaris lumbricoides TaxID=6252 RepID=A0A0M3IMP6_ASCLU